MFLAMGMADDEEPSFVPEIDLACILSRHVDNPDTAGRIAYYVQDFLQPRGAMETAEESESVLRPFSPEQTKVPVPVFQNLCLFWALRK